MFHSVPAIMNTSETVLCPWMNDSSAQELELILCALFCQIVCFFLSCKGEGAMPHMKQECTMTKEKK